MTTVVRVQQFLPRHPLVVDIAIAVLCSALGLVQGAHDFRSGPQSAVLPEVTLTLVGSIPLIVRRRWPLIVYLVNGIALCLALFLPAIAPISALVALYSLAVYRSVRSAWWAFAVTVIVLPAAALIQLPDFETVNRCLLALLPLLVGVALGSNAANRHQHVQSLIALALQLQETQEQEARLAAIAERGRIAGEMHDIVAHALTVVITLSEGASTLVEKSPDRAADLMGEVAEAGRHALADLRRTLDILSEGEVHNDTPQPDLQALPDLVGRLRASGMQLEVRRTGIPPSDPGHQLAVFRILQEALTNAARYGSPQSPTTASVDCTDRTTTLVVENSGVAAGQNTHGSGRGILGMQQRAALYGGTVIAGPTVGGGWRVSATLSVANGVDR